MDCIINILSAVSLWPQILSNLDYTWTEPAGCLSWSIFSSHWKSPHQQHTTLFTPHFNVSGAFLTFCVAARRWAQSITHMHNCTLPARTYRVWCWCLCMKRQHLSSRSVYTLQEWFHPVRSLPVMQMQIHTHVWKSPSHSYFHPETCFYKNCKFVHLTQLINLLFIICTDERLGWRMGGNVFAMTMSMQFVHHPSLLPHLLCSLQ